MESQPQNGQDNFKWKHGYPKKLGTETTVFKEKGLQVATVVCIRGGVEAPTNTEGKAIPHEEE